jgi:LemA protein
LTIALIVIAALIVVIALWFVLTFNALVRLRNEVAQGLSSIDVQLKRRADLIPNLVEAVKGYAQHETATFESVSTARAHALGATTLDEKAAADGELRAVESFTQLQTELSDTEDKIAAARRYYNTTVRIYNTKQQTLPTSLISGALGHQLAEFYRLDDDAEREPIKVELGA